MWNIHKLSKQLANQIAAWEVVERPLSVVKELLENSLDADATKIEIFLENGGMSFIELRDNGSGIEKEDLGLAIEKYSTSKIAHLEDLYHIMSYGFRGEALASIASVSHFSLTSKTKNSQIAYKLSASGWDDVNISESSWGIGTKIRVENLFFNTPARKAYMKTEKTEFSKISDFTSKMALAYPENSFLLEHNGNKVFSYAPVKDFSTRMYQVYGKEFLEQMLEVEFFFEGMRVFGFISDPKVSFSNKNKHITFVNRRLIASPTLSKAISDAYNRFIPHGTFPAYILFLDIDPSEIDVNVHPRKLEIRFADEQRLFRAAYHAVLGKLEKVSVIWEEWIEKFSDFSSMSQYSSFWRQEKEIKTQYYTGSGTKFKNYSPYKDTSVNPAQAAISFSAAILWGFRENISQENIHDSAEINDLHYTPLGKIIGQAYNSYIILERNNAIVILDQHALAERVNYEKLAKKSWVSVSQGIIGGISLHLDLQEFETLQEYKEILENLGFEIEIFPWENIMLYAIPDFIKRENIEKIFKEIVSDISSVGSKSLDEVRHKIWAYTACRSAVKFWDPLSLLEMNKLLHDASLDYSATCPHGRPVVWEISLSELQKKYER